MEIRPVVFGVDCAASCLDEDLASDPAKTGVQCWHAHLDTG